MSINWPTSFLPPPSFFLSGKLKYEGLKGLPGFRQIRWACGLFVLWNVVAFVGHWSEVLLIPQAFRGQQGDLSQSLIMSRFSAWIYYLTRLDHLVLVPAFFLLWRGLRALLAKTPREAP